MANLRKRVAACDLERRRPVSEEQYSINTIHENGHNPEVLDNRPLLPKVRLIVFILNIL